MAFATGALQASIWNKQREGGCPHPQELQVALMVDSGVTNREAGSRLFRSAKTIEAHVGRICRKLGVRSRTELAAFVARTASART